MESRYQTTSHRSGSGIAEMLDFFEQERTVDNEFSKDGIKVLYTFEINDRAKRVDDFRILKKGAEYYCATTKNGIHEFNSLSDCLLFGFSYGYITLDEYRKLSNKTLLLA